MPVKRSPQKPPAADRLPVVQVTGASDVDEVGSIVSNVGRDFGRLEAEARGEKLFHDGHSTPPWNPQRTLSLQDVRQFGNRGRVVSLTPSVERDFGVDTPKGDDQAGFEEAAGVGGAGADPEVVERAHTPKGDDQAGFEEAAGVGGAGVDPEVFARALQDAQDAQRKLAGDESVKRQLRQSIGNRKGVVT